MEFSFAKFVKLMAKPKSVKIMSFITHGGFTAKKDQDKKRKKENLVPKSAQGLTLLTSFKSMRFKLSFVRKKYSPFNFVFTGNVFT